MGHLGWGAKYPDMVSFLTAMVMRNENAAREFTKSKRAKPFMGLRKPGAASRMADVVMEFLNKSKVNFKPRVYQCEA